MYDVSLIYSILHGVLDTKRCKICHGIGVGFNCSNASTPANATVIDTNMPQMATIDDNAIHSPIATNTTMHTQSSTATTTKIIQTRSPSIVLRIAYDSIIFAVFPRQRQIDIS